MSLKGKETENLFSYGTLREEKETENLFAYGTLREEEVQLSTFGRKLEGTPDVLPGYRLGIIRIEDQDFVIKSGRADHLNLQFTGVPSDYVEGFVFRVTKKALEQADAYEPVGYGRALVRLKSGKNAWVYLNIRQEHNTPLVPEGRSSDAK